MQQAHSGAYSIHANYTYDTTAYAVTKYPYLVDASDTLSFWTFYDLEYNGDVAFLEISTDGLVWDQLCRLTGYQAFWHKRSLPLSDYAGRSLYFRFRLSSDASDRYQGIYIDDFSPAVNYDSIRLTRPLADTFYEFTAVPAGTYFYRTQGYNNQGAGIHSQLTRIDVSVPIAEADLNTTVELPILPTVARQLKLDNIPGLKIYNILGQKIADVIEPGVYFVERDQEITKIIIID